MKKLIKLLTTLILLALITGCIVNIEQDNIITVNNNTGSQIDYMYVIPTTDFYAGNYSYPTDVLANKIFPNDSTFEINLDNYSSTYLSIVAVVTGNSPAWVADVYYTDNYETLDHSDRYYGTLQ